MAAACYGRDRDGPGVQLLLGLGGNLGDPPAAFRAALRALAEQVPLRAVSQLYRSDAVGPPQPRYWNLVALLELQTPLLALLDRCQALEAAAGRDRSHETCWGPRLLDLDLLAAEGVVHRGPRLELPHPRFRERAFALVPAAELASGWRLPGEGRALAELACAVEGADQLQPCGRLELCNCAQTASGRDPGWSRSRPS